MCSSRGPDSSTRSHKRLKSSRWDDIAPGFRRVNPYGEYYYDGITIDPFEVMFVKVKDLLLERRWSYALQASKYDAWMAEQVRCSWFTALLNIAPRHCSQRGGFCREAGGKLVAQQLPRVAAGLPAQHGCQSGMNRLCGRQAQTPQEAAEAVLPAGNHEGGRRCFQRVALGPWPPQVVQDWLHAVFW